MRASSVATTTCIAPTASARRTTCTTIGSPAISRSGLPGRREAPKRAGMATMNSSVMAWVIAAQWVEFCIEGTVEVYRQLRPHRHGPCVGQAEVATFHRVFFSHQPWTRHDRKVLGTIAVMIGKRVFTNGYAETAQRLEK